MRIGHCQLDSQLGDFSGNLEKVVEVMLVWHVGRELLILNWAGPLLKRPQE